MSELVAIVLPLPIAIALVFVLIVMLALSAVALSFRRPAPVRAPSLDAGETSRPAAPHGEA
ncbi:hypothetical protein LK542_11525 [Massilia sp. IC2-477]|uniref:hypothetical protein n=1 Tax=unclassified Massilia TaxID=2609279 RepID=UPI001D0FC75F|nr:MULTISPECIES: hypothetical protein [unclassified Massilia]MCC2956245.1 hypothetical protein [Massilia sp. IC2-477]MCC2972384.1 hypothetical protein [Massilia sp. IC2-476]